MVGGKKVKIAILGAGISGITAAKLLSEKGHDVIVFEKEKTPGGLATSRITDGYLYDPHGGHVFNSKNPQVMEWIFSILPKENWQYTKRIAKIYFEGKYISYPFELSLRELNADDAVECAYDFIFARRGDEPNNFRDWLLWNFGSGISRRYMIPYNEKTWAYPLEEMDTQWVQGKMPIPNEKDMICSILKKDFTESKMPHATFYYPLHGGIQTMVNAIAAGLNIYCNSPVRVLRKEKEQWIVNEDKIFDAIISTIPLPMLPTMMELPKSVIEHINDLKYNSMTTVLFDCPKTDITWLYLPSPDYRAHRVGYQSALTPHASKNSQRGCASLEIIGEKFEISSSFSSESDVLPKELGFTKILDSEFTEYAYVIHDLKYRRNISAILQYFSRDPSFKLLGRWGTWNYKNMDLCILDAMNLVRGM